jgi:hypothetical protein
MNDEEFHELVVLENRMRKAIGKPISNIYTCAFCLEEGKSQRGAEGRNIP